MKKIIIALITISSSTFCVAQTKIKRSLPEAAVVANDVEKLIQFDRDEHDFGKVPEGPLAVTSFTITNISNQPFLINDIKGSCSCTKAEWDRSPILPGKTKTIKATFDTKDKAGSFNKNLTVITNQGYKDFKFKGFVIKKK